MKNAGNHYFNNRNHILNKKKHVNIGSDRLRYFISIECNHTDRPVCVGLIQMLLLCVYSSLAIRVFSLMSCWAAQSKQLFYQWDYYARHVEHKVFSDRLFLSVSTSFTSPHSIFPNIFLLLFS